VLPPAASVVEAHAEEGPHPHPPPPGGPRGSASSLQARKTPQVPSLSPPSPYRTGGRGVRLLRPWIALSLAILPISLGIWGLKRPHPEVGSTLRAQELVSPVTSNGASSVASVAALAPSAVESSPAGAPSSVSAALAPRVGTSGASAMPSGSGKGVGRGTSPVVKRLDPVSGGGEAAPRAPEPVVDPLDQLGPRK
jgi:hypothetical protein